MKPKHVLSVFDSPRFITVSNIQVAYRSAGKGIPLICLPGWPASSLMYAPLAALLQKNVTCIAFDIPGWGGYSTDLEGPVSVSRYADIVEQSIQALAINPVSILGHSYGGVISMELVKRGVIVPQHVILSSTFYTGKDTLLTILEQTFRTVFFNLRKLGLSDETIKDIIIKIISAAMKYQPYYSHHQNTSPLLELMAAEVKMGNFDIAYESVRALENAFVYSEQLHHIKTLILYGQYDLPLVRRESHELAQKLGIEAIRLTGVGHNHITFRPELAAAQIERVLAGS